MRRIGAVSLWCALQFVLLLAVVLPLHSNTPGHHTRPKPEDLISLSEEWRNGLPANADFSIERDPKDPSHKQHELKSIMHLADQGNAIAQYNLGYRYENGIGVPKDFEEAAVWYEKAANQNLPMAAYRHGMFLSEGMVKQDLIKAATRFQQAAERGYVPAQFVWAVTLKTGRGVQINIPAALQWFQKAASSNYAPAQCDLGNMHDEGIGVPRNPAEAARFYRLAATQGYALAQHNLAVSYAQGSGVKQSFEEAAKWYRLAAENNDLWSQHNLANAYANGRGLQRDHVEAVRWFRRAAERGLAESQYAYGGCLLQGRGVPTNYVEAVIWLNKAAAQDHPFALGSLGMILLDGGPGVPPDVERGIQLVKASAEYGFSWAQRSLGCLYAEGKLIRKDNAEAYKWLTLAVQQGEELAVLFREKYSKLMTPADVVEGYKRAKSFVPSIPKEPETGKKYYHKPQR